MKSKILYNTIQRGMPMILYVDETECGDYFIVAGLLTESKEETDYAYKKFKKKIKNMPLSAKQKEKIFVEFKSVLLDKEFQKIKIRMLEHINNLDYSVLFSVYNKKDCKMNQETKEKQYIELLNTIVSHINTDIDIIFDAFNKKDFEQNIIDTISAHKTVLSIRKQDSRLEAGVQFIDNICSIIRLNKTNVENDFFRFIESKVIEL